MVRYAVLTPSLAQPGGAERHIYALIANADPTRLRCAGVVLSGFGGVDPTLCREIISHGVPIVGEVAKGRYFRRELDIVKPTFDTLSIAVRHACKHANVLVTWGSLAMARFTSGLDIPVVSVSHCNEHATSGITGITHLVGVSHAATKYWSHIQHDLPVAILPNGVEVEHCAPDRGRDWQRAQWGVKPDEVLVGYVGRHHPVKRPWLLLHALSGLPANYRGIMVGNQINDYEHPAASLVDTAAALGVTDRIRFEPMRSQMGDVYAALDVLMVTSVREADSLVTKEAMLCDLPVCTTRVGAITEMEEEFGAGNVAVVIEDPESIENLACAVTLAAGPQGRQVADNMHGVAWSRWTAGAMARRWVDYLEGVAGQR